MIYMKYVTLIVIFLLMSCSNNRRVISNDLPLEMYISAQQKLENYDYKSAIKEFEELNNFDPSGPYSQQILLNLIYAYYKISDLISSQKYINDFIRFNPDHQNIDYVLYMRGLTNMEMANNLLQNFFSLNNYNNDPIYIYAAFHDFSSLVRRYPYSQFATDATKRLIFLKNSLAEYNLSIIKFYNQHGAYIAVINRVEQMLYNFQDTQSTRTALLYMKQSYQKLYLNSQVRKINQIIQLNN